MTRHVLELVPVFDLPARHAKRPRYEAEVPRGSGSPIQRRYRLTLQYVGGGEWQVKGMQFATRY